MANYNQISYGSNGSDVTELQKLLNQNGYTLDTDGIFGSNTQAAVKDYQQKNGLTVDGIVGNNTWGALTSANSSTNTETTTPEEPKTPTYTPSDTVTQAEALLQQHLANKPGEYQSTWQDQLNDIINRINNREDFSYDLNGDALYQQYKDQYTTQGKLAMMDTMGQAAALTGGYGSSYGQAVGQQAYQGYLQQLNDRIPELYQLALSQYNAEGDEMYNQASLLAGMEDQEYGRHRDLVSDYYTELDRLTGAHNTERDYDYNQWYNNLMYQYQTDRDKIADEQWQAQFDEAKRQFDLQYNKSSGSGSGGSGGGYSYSGRTYSAPEGWDEAKIMEFQEEAGLAVDGKWGPKTQAAYENSTEYSNNPTTGTTTTVDTNSVSSEIKAKAGSFKTNDDLGNYLDGLAASGTITEAQADSLYAQYKQPDTVALSNRSWTLVDDGGINWFGGIDNNATVKDQYGNTYRLDKLKTALIEAGISKSEAENYVKSLQKSLGA